MIRPIAFAALMSAALTTQPARADLETYVGMCAGSNSTPHEMINFCQKAIDTGRLGDQAKAQVYTNMSIGYFELGQYETAVWAGSQAIEAKPDLIVAYLERARAYEKLRRLQEAAADYQAALDIDRNAADAYLGRGILLLRNGDPYRAVEDLTAALEIEPGWTAARFNRGLAYLQIGQNARAVQDFDDLIRRSPQDAGGYLYRAQGRAALGDQDAVEDFDQAIALKGEWALAWFVRGRYRDSQGDSEGANADFLRAYELGYSDPWLIDRVREISR